MIKVMKVSRRKPHTQRGVSLIELMIAMTLGLAIVAAVGYVYVSGTTGYRVQSNQSRMQEDARFIVETVSRDVRMGGYFGCARSDIVGNQGYIELKASKPVMTSDTDWLLGRADSKNEDRFLDPSNFVRGFSAAASNTAKQLPGYATLAGKLQPGSDVLLVLRAGEEHSAVLPVSTTTDSAIDTGQVNIAQPLPGVATGDQVTLVMADCEVAKIFKPSFTVIKIGAVAASLKTDNATNHVVNDGSVDENDHAFKDGAVVSMFTPSILYVTKPESAGKLPLLKRASIAQNNPLNYGGWDTTGGQIVASGVETFQASYIVTANLGTDSATSEELSVAAMEASPSKWPSVTAVRVRFTMVSQENGTAATQADGKLRQSYDFTVGIRGRQYKGVN